MLLSVIRIFRIPFSCAFVAPLFREFFLVANRCHPFFRGAFCRGLLRVAARGPFPLAAFSRAFFPGRRRHNWSVSP
jgi:hypothetical protein